jgi:hypothetical protein
MQPEQSSDAKLAEYLHARQARRDGRQPKPLIELASDPLAAVSYAVAVVRGGDVTQMRTALDQLEARIAVLRDTSSMEAQSALIAHLVPLEEAFCRMLAEAMEAKDVERKMKLVKLAVQLQNSYARTFALVATLQAQGKGGGAKVIISDD